MKRLLTPLLVLLFLSPSTLWADLTADQTPFHSFRGWWVNRWEYGGTEAGIINMFNRAEQLGLTDVVFQVRGQADAYYWNNDGVEVRHSSVTPSFDPLGVAIREAHARGMRLHAWMNVAPLWLGTSMPSNPNHLVYQNPNPANPDPYYEGWIRDYNRERQPLNSHYVIKNLTMDEVHAHVNNVVKTIAKNYNIDGIHLDYVRYLNNTGSMSTPILYPTDPDTLARYTADTGNTFDPINDQSNSAKRNAYKQWMGDRLTELVTQIRYTTKEYRPHAQLTAAVWRDANIGFRDYQQEWDRWVREGILDAAMPMIYRRGFAGSDPGDLYRNNTAAAMNHGGSAGVMIGLGTYLQSGTYQEGYDNVMNQLIYARDQGANGIMIYNHGTLYDGHPAREGARQALMDFFADNSAPPPVLSLASFETGNDTFTWNITVSGSNRNVASGSVQRVSGDAAEGNWAQQITINKTAGASDFLARHVSGGGSPANNLELVSIGSIGFWLKTTTPDLQVAIALDDRADNSSTERSYFKNVIDDGQWHRYEWFLNDVTHWEAWAGANRDGKIDNRFWLDSVQFIGTEGANVILFDEVFYDRAAVAPNQWVFNGSADWSHWAHWQGGAPNGIDATANFLRRATGPVTVNIDAPVTLGTIHIDNDSSYTLAGNTVTMQVSSGEAAINVVNRGTHTIAAPVSFASSTGIFVDRGSTLNLNGLLSNTSGSTLSKTGVGTLNINGNQSHGSGATFNANAGKTVFNTNAGTGTIHRLNVNINNAGTAVDFNATQNLASLAIGGGAQATLTPGGSKVVKANALAIAAGGTLDLNNGHLIVMNGNIADVSGHVAAGRLVSTIADADPQRAVAVVHNSALGFTTFSGQVVNSTSVIATVALLGDANLDGKVDIADLSIVAANWQQPNSYWQHGDFNYSGVVDIGDLSILAANWQAEDAGMSFAEAMAMFDAFNGVLIPEPAAAPLLGLIALAGLRRRGRTSA